MYHKVNHFKRTIRRYPGHSRGCAATPSASAPSHPAEQTRDHWGRCPGALLQRLGLFRPTPWLCCSTCFMGEESHST